MSPAVNSNRLIMLIALIKKVVKNNNKYNRDVNKYRPICERLVKYVNMKFFLIFRQYFCKRQTNDFHS